MIAAQVFSYEFCEISKNTFFTEHLWTTASKYVYMKVYFIPGKTKMMINLQHKDRKVKRKVQ